MRTKLNPTPDLRDLRELLLHAEETHGDRNGYMEIDPSGTITTRTFRQLRLDVEAASNVLTDAGLGGVHCAIVGENSYAYVVAYLAVITAGGVAVPLDKEHTGRELAELANKGDAEALFYGDSLADDIPALLEACPRVRVAIPLGQRTHADGVRTLKAMLTEGRRAVLHGDDRWRRVPLDPGALAAILFTSGTTGPNKGVMLSQLNMLSAARAGVGMLRLAPVSISVLPMNHAYEFNLHVLGSILHGINLCINDSLLHVQRNLALFRPEMSLMVPMIVEALHRNIWKKATEAHLDKHLRYGIWYSNLLRKVGIDKRALFFKPILRDLGGLRMIVCGGAPLSHEVVRGLDDIGIEVLNGYGITEYSPLVSCNTWYKRAAGSIGVLAPGCEAKIDDPDANGFGEILVRGPGLMLGYYNDPEATAATITPDGWLRTGDYGRLRRDGVLFISGRRKNLIILGNGKNVQPEELEGMIGSRLAYVRESVVYQRPASAEAQEQIAVCAYLDPDYVSSVGEDAARARFAADIAALNRELAAHKRLHHVEVAATEFEKTATKKVKRYAFLSKESVPC